MLYNDVPIGLCAVGLGSGVVLLSGRWVEPIGGVTYRKVIRDWGLQSRLCTPSLALCFLLCGEILCSSASSLLALALQQVHWRPTAMGLTSVWTRIFERSNQKQLCFLYKFIMSSVLLVVQGCLMQMRGGKRNVGKGLRWPSSVGVGTEPDHSEQRYSESDRSRGLGFQLSTGHTGGLVSEDQKGSLDQELESPPKGKNILASSLQAYFLLLQKLSLWGPAVGSTRSFPEHTSGYSRLPVTPAVAVSDTSGPAHPYSHVHRHTHIHTH